MTSDQTELDKIWVLFWGDKPSENRDEFVHSLDPKWDSERGLDSLFTNSHEFHEDEHLQAIYGGNNAA